MRPEPDHRIPAPPGSPAPPGDAESERFVRALRNAGLLIGLGVVVVLGAVALLAVIAGGILGLGVPGRGPGPDRTPLGVGLLVVALAGAVALFFAAGRVVRRAGPRNGPVVPLSPAALERHGRLARSARGRTALAVVIALLVVVIAFAAAHLLEVIGGGGPVFGPIAGIAAVVRLLGVGASAGLLAVAALGARAHDRAGDHGLLSPAKLERDRRIAGLIAPYWSAVALLYLAWSLLAGSWLASWLVWPIAGTLFLIVAGVLAAERR
ncbi:MAG: hypothetical protein GXX90_01910 [Microbacteriaceae bacterium]|nr:hypothetical protein [Microbacteriaceae bacterium]